MEGTASLLWAARIVQDHNLNHVTQLAVDDDDDDDFVLVDDVINVVVVVLGVAVVVLCGC